MVSRQTSPDTTDGLQLFTRQCPRFGKSGTWFRDREGRFASFRGVNFAGRSKFPPFLPFPTADFSNVQPDLDRLRDLGFNIVRLLVMWKRLEPQVRFVPRGP